MAFLGINKTNITIGKKLIHWTQLFFYLFIISLFLPIRHTFFTHEAYLLGQYSDFTSFSLYLSDIFLFLTAFFTFLPPRGGIKKQLIVNSKLLIVLVFWLILGLIWHFQSFSRTNLWFFLKFIELFVAYGTFRVLFRETSTKLSFFKLFSFLAAGESIIALAQFIHKGSVGLHKLGESIIGANLTGTAKVVAHNTLYIRAYGTFPHPNILSAFLLTAIFFSIYLFSVSESNKARVAYGLLIFLNILGITVTFSRAAFLALAIGLIFYFGYIFLRLFNEKQGIWPYSKQWNNNYNTIIVVIISIITSFLIFQPFLLSRATVTDNASVERVFLNKIGLKIIKTHPFFGVGIGEGVLHMEQFSGRRLEFWQKQPVHNYFLESAAELGILGPLLLLIFFLSHLKSLILLVRRSFSEVGKSNFTTRYLLLTTLLLTFLVLMQFDHYFYDLQSTQLLLWMILGLIAAQTKNPHPQSGEGDSTKTYKT